MTAMSREPVYEYWHDRYVAPVSVITAAGNVDHAAVVDLVAGAPFRGMLRRRAGCVVRTSPVPGAAPGRVTRGRCR